MCYLDSPVVVLLGTTITIRHAQKEVPLSNFHVCLWCLGDMLSVYTRQGRGLWCPSLVHAVLSLYDAPGQGSLWQSTSSVEKRCYFRRREN